MPPTPPSVLLCYPRLQFRAQDIPKPDGSLALPYLAGALRRAGIPVRIFDASIGDDRDDLQVFYRPKALDNGMIRVGVSDARFLEEVARADIIAITSIFTMQTTQVLEMIGLVKRHYPAKRVILGGVNARWMKRRLLAAGADTIFLSEADETIVEYVRRIEAKDDTPVDGTATWDGTCVCVTPARRVIQDLDTLPMPAWDLLPNDRYWAISRPHGGDFAPGTTIRYGAMMTSRGCPFACSYCHTSKETEADEAGAIGALRCKSVERVLAEARVLRDLGVEYLFLEDDSLLAKKARVRDVFRGLHSLRLKLIDVNGVNLVHLFRRGSGGRLEVDEDLLDLMAEAGFTKLTLPFESGSQRILDRWASRKWRLEALDTASLIRACRARGITALGNYTIGYPDESFDEMLGTVSLAQQHADAGLDVASFFVIVPFPGTTLFDHAIANGHLAEDFDPDQMNWTRSVLRNTPVSSDTVEAVRAVAWRLINRPDFVQSRLQLSGATLRDGIGMTEALAADSAC